MANRLELVGEEAAPSPTPQATNAAVAGLMLALRALSQRAVVAAASLVDLALIASAFALWWSIIESPSVLQIVTASIYSVFILCIVWLRSRRNAEFIRKTA